MPPGAMVLGHVRVRVGSLSGRGRGQEWILQRGSPDRSRSLRPAERICFIFRDIGHRERAGEGPAPPGGIAARRLTYGESSICVAPEHSEFMRFIGQLNLAWLAFAAALGCASAKSAAEDAPEPSAPPLGYPAPCASAGTDGVDTTSVCATSPGMLVTQQLQETVHDLRRLGLANAIREVGKGRVALMLGETALERHIPLAYHLERLYRAYRIAYDYGDETALELWYNGEQVGTYTSQGLLLR